MRSSTNCSRAPASNSSSTSPPARSPCPTGARSRSRSTRSRAPACSRASTRSATCCARTPRSLPTNPACPPTRNPTMHADIVVLPGDGIGPEVTAAAVAVLRAVARVHGHRFDLHEHAIGGAAIDASGEPLPAATLAACRAADAVLLGAVGGPKWSDPNAKVRPEQGLLALRKGLGLYANLRPVQPHAATLGAAPIKPHLLAGVDLVVVRELTGGIYFGD